MALSVKCQAWLEQLPRSEGGESAVNYVISQISRMETADAKKIAFESLATLYGDLGHQELKAIALEQLVSLFPNDADFLFNAAHFVNGGSA